MTVTVQREGRLLSVTVVPEESAEKNLFGEDVTAIMNRKHVVQAAVFDYCGKLSLKGSATAAPFPRYLKGNPYVWFLQDVRLYTNYACTIQVDCPVPFYLLVDNRVNDFEEASTFADPSFGPPDTEWITQDGWIRVNTGISPQVAGASCPDYLAIHERGVGAIGQFYAIYSKAFPKGGSVTLRTQFEGNIYCLVVATNSAPDSVKAPEVPKPPQPREGGWRCPTEMQAIQPGRLLPARGDADPEPAPRADVRFDSPANR